MQIRNVLLFIMPLAIIGCRSVAQSSIRTNAPDIRRIHPVPGTHLVRFQKLDEGVYKGSKPKTDADYEFLRAKGIKYIVNLKFFPWINNWEKHKAKKYGMTLLTGTISASPMEPSEEHVNAVLCLLRDQRYHPIYIHCDLGRDRAMLITGLYEMYYKGKSKEEAWHEMKYYGFKDDWTLAGLKNYFEKHSRQPVSNYIPHCQEHPLQSSSLRKETGDFEGIDLDALPYFAESCP
jgi:hypothetical protein